MGPAPAVAAIRRAVRGALESQPAHRMVLVACSGGADSTALAAATAFECARSGRAAGLVTIDHQLQVGSAERAAAVAIFGSELGLSPVVGLAVDVLKYGGPEAAARTARYSALADVADAHQALVLLGHTADDQAETVLLGLGRGSGPRSIAGMRAVEGRYLRPFLGLRRSSTEAACDALGLPVWQDPHNDDSRFTRVRLRHEVLPLMDSVLAGGVVGALARTATLVRQDLDALDELAERLLLRCAIDAAPIVADNGRPCSANELEIAPLADQPVALTSRVLKRWVESHGAPITAVHVEELGRLLTNWHGQGPIELPGGAAVGRASGRLTIRAV